jgi:peptidoglycan/xylan/chitin deacetylase (PgdA/CDA1 family)
MRTLILALAALAATPAAAARDIAITFDDLPVHSALPPGVTRLQVARDVIGALKAAGAPQVYGFINGAQLGTEPGTDAVLKAWRDAGFPLGNHGWAHLGLSKIDELTFESELTRNEPILQPLAGGTDWHWFRFPFLDEAYGDPARREASRAWLAAHGYKIAAVTASFGDYAFNEPYARCAAKGDKAAIAQLEQAYLAAAAASIRLSATVEKAQFGRTPPDILLMHIGAFDAHMLPRLLALYKANGFRFVTLPDAAKDPANIGLVDPKAPPLPGRTLGDAQSAARLQQIGDLCR